MNKVYRLLRNNKEQGPFTSEELIQKGLKPYDLIWIDGRSAAWSYPGELAEFKLYVPDADKQDSSVLIKNAETASQVSASVQAAVAMTNNLAQSGLTKQKPRYKVSAAWSKIQTVTAPVHSEVMIAEPKKTASTKLIDTTYHEPVNSKSLSWEEAWLDWKTEKKPIPALKGEAVKPAAGVEKKIINQPAGTAPVLEKKFEQSLDTITNNYIDNILQQKKRSKQISFDKTSEFILPSIALIVIFSIGYWLMHDNKTASALNAAPVKQQQIVTENQNKELSSNVNTAVLNDKEKSQGKIPAENTETDAAILDEPAARPVVTEKSSDNYSQDKKSVSPVKNSVALNSEVINKNIPATTSVTSDAYQKKSIKAANKQFDASVINNIPDDNAYNDQSDVKNGDLNASENRPVRRRTNNTAVSNQPSNNQPVYNNSSITKNTKAKTAINYVSVPEYITMNDGNGSLKIENISDVNLDLVVVDVLYYDGSSRFRKGETLYLHNLRAGKTVMVKTPRDINSSYATSKVSLVSSDVNNVYAVGDN